MRSAARTPLGRLAIAAGIVAVALAFAVPIALGVGSASGPVTNYVTYTGGKAGKANPKLSPVVIGAINTQGGQVLVGPGWSNGVKTAVQYVNKYLGGVGGHPLVVRYCFTTSAEEEGTKCGQQFANDKQIKVVEFGAVAVGNQSFYAALGNKKPTVGGVELLPVDAQRKNGFALFGTNDSVLGPWGTLGKDVLHAKTAAVVYVQIPGIDYGATVEKASLESAGIKTTLVGFPPTATDLTGPLTAAGAQNADMIVPQSNAAGCVNIAKALSQLGKSGTPVVSNPLCLDPAVPAGLGGDLPKWIYGIASSLGFDTTDPAVKPFVQRADPGRAAEARGRRLGDRRLGPDPDDREADEPDRRQQGHLGELHLGDQGVQGPAGPRRSEPQLREVPRRAGCVQRPGAVLPVPGRREVQAHHGLPEAAEHLQARRLSTTSPDRAGPRQRGPASSGA